MWNVGGTALSTSVQSCVVSTATVTLILGKDMSSADFKVHILNAAAWTASTTAISSLSLTNFGVSVQT